MPPTRWKTRSYTEQAKELTMSISIADIFVAGCVAFAMVVAGFAVHKYVNRTTTDVGDREDEISDW